MKVFVPEFVRNGKARLSVIIIAGTLIMGALLPPLLPWKFCISWVKITYMAITLTNFVTTFLTFAFNISFGIMRTFL